MINSRVNSIKRAQKESLISRKISQFLLQITLDEPRLQELTVSRVQLSSDKSIVNIFLYTPKGKEAFDELFSLLLLYKPSLRKALSQAVPARYTPDLMFKYDVQFEKQCELEMTLNKLKTEEES